jgi:hypothetical protein
MFGLSLIDATTDDNPNIAVKIGSRIVKCDETAIAFVKPDRNLISHSLLL